MRDLFARWATTPKSGVTGVAGVTNREEPRICDGFSPEEGVTRSERPGVTGVTTGRTPSRSAEAVTHVTHTNNEGVTGPSLENCSWDKGSFPLSHPSHVSHAKAGNSADTRCSLAECLALVREAFEVVASHYVEGALALLATDAELCRRFHETEAAIDAVAKLGPTEDELWAALAAHVGVIRECCARQQACRDRAAEVSSCQ